MQCACNSVCDVNFYLLAVILISVLFKELVQLVCCPDFMHYDFNHLLVYCVFNPNCNALNECNVT